MGKAVTYIENALLVIVGLLTLAGAAKAVYSIVERREAGLQDLLLMFIFVEVFGMAGAYYESKKIPITYPVFIAITALARFTILQKEQEPINLLYEAGAILMLAIAAYVLEVRGSRFAPGFSQQKSPAAAQPRGQDSKSEAKP